MANYICGGGYTTKYLKNSCTTCPGTKVLPLYSTGSNGLPLAKIARPFTFKKNSKGQKIRISLLASAI